MAKKSLSEKEINKLEKGVSNDGKLFSDEAKEMKVFDISPYVINSLEELGEAFHKIFKELGIGR
jgi:hypothetical protein